MPSEPQTRGLAGWAAEVPATPAARARMSEGGTGDAAVHGDLLTDGLSGVIGRAVGSSPPSPRRPFRLALALARGVAPCGRRGRSRAAALARAGGQPEFAPQRVPGLSTSTLAPRSGMRGSCRRKLPDARSLRRGRRSCTRRCTPSPGSTSSTGRENRPRRRPNSGADNDVGHEHTVHRAARGPQRRVKDQIVIAVAGYHDGTAPPHVPAKIRPGRRWARQWRVPRSHVSAPALETSSRAPFRSPAARSAAPRSRALCARRPGWRG